MIFDNQEILLILFADLKEVDFANKDESRRKALADNFILSN